MSYHFESNVSGITTPQLGQCGVACEAPYQGDRCDDACQWESCSLIKIEALKTCYNSLTVSNAEKADIVATLNTMLDFYVFTDMSLQSPDPNYPLAVDLRQGLQQIAQNFQHSNNAAAFHDAVCNLFNSLNDAHTAYFKPLSYDATYALFPLLFSHYVDSNGHHVVVSNAFFGRLQQLVGLELLAIDGVPAVDFFTAYANEWVGISRDLGTRFNLAILLWGVRSMSMFPLSNVPSGNITLTFATDNGPVDLPGWYFLGYSMQGVASSIQLGLADHIMPAASEKRASDRAQDAFHQRYVKPERIIDGFFPEIELQAAGLSLPSIEQLVSSKQLKQQEKASQPSEKSKQRRAKALPSEVQSTTGTTTRDEAPPSLFTLRETEAVDGYLLETDTLIIWIKTFSPKDYDLFQMTIVDLLLFAQDNEVKKLIIDLRDNGGGSVCLGYSVLDYLFHGEFNPYGQYDFAAPELSQRMATASMRVGPEQSEWAPQYWVDPSSNEPYADDSWMVPPRRLTRNNRTSPYSQRVHDECMLDFWMWPQPQHHLPYKADQIMILTHGFCGSTCAVFSKHLSELEEARSVTIGGLPDRPQSIASFPGGQVFTLDALLSTLSALNMSTDPAAPKPFPISATFSFTLREIYSWSQGKEQTPLDFVFEPSDFHQGYTADSWQDQAALYAQAAAFFDAECVNCNPSSPSKSSTVIWVTLLVLGVLILIGIATTIAYVWWKRRETAQEIRYQHPQIGRAHV